MPSTIAVIGTGNVGAALGSAFAGAGHDVVYGARSPESDGARAAVAATRGATATSIGDAASGAEVIVLAVPWDAVAATAKLLGDVGGRIVVDATNPLKADLSEGKSPQAAASRGSMVTWCPSASRRLMRLRVARSGFWRV